MLSDGERAPHHAGQSYSVARLHLAMG